MQRPPAGVSTLIWQYTPSQMNFSCFFSHILQIINNYPLFNLYLEQGFAKI